MRSHGDARELRGLQERAYGRVGGLTAEEAARLRDLETGTGAVPDEYLSEVPDDEGGRADATASVSVATPQEPVTSSTRSPSTRRWMLLIIVLAVSMAAGLAIGWALFSDRDDAKPLQLSAQQQQWQDDLVSSGRYDPGSVKAMREESGVLVWFATTGGGGQVCLVLGDAQDIVPTCAPREQALMQGLTGSLVTSDEDGVSYEVDAQLLVTGAGEPAVIAYHFVTTTGATGAAYSTPAEAATAHSLVELGLDPRSIVIAGYDGDVPIWVGVERATQRHCLIYDGRDGSGELTCTADAVSPFSESQELTSERTDDDGTTTRYVYALGGGPHYLTIIKHAGGADVDGE